MIDPTKNETRAMQSTLQPLGDYVASIGMQRSLADYSQQEVLQLIDVVITSYQNKLQELTPNDAPFNEDDIPF